MKIKRFINIALLLVPVIVFSSCTKKPLEQNSKNDKDTVKSVQKTSFDIKTVSKETLPQNIKDYVALNYKEYKINDAAYDPLCEGGDAIDVSIDNNGKTALSLIFKPDGTYIQKEEDIPFKDAPLKVKEVIKTKYGSYKASNQIEKLTLADNAIQYLIDIDKNSVFKEVTLTSDGQIVCEN
jgi:hypothetical protein